MSAVEARLAAIEARLSALEARASTTTVASSGEPAADTFSPDKLQTDWADKIVGKDLPRWTGESMVGKRFSECPAEWHDSASGFFEWKAAKGRAENPPRLDNKGKPWHEKDTFMARLHRTWSKHLRDTPPKPAMSEPSTSDGEAFGEDLPF